MDDERKTTSERWVPLKCLANVALLFAPIAIALAFWLWRPTAMAGMWTVWSPAQFGQAGDVPIRRPRWGKAVWRRTIDAFTRIIIP